MAGAGEYEPHTDRAQGPTGGWQLYLELGGVVGTGGVRAPEVGSGGS